MFNLFKNLVQNKSTKNILSKNNKVSNPLKIDNTLEETLYILDSIKPLKNTVNVYTQEEIKYLMKLRGRCKTWEEVTEKYNKKFPNNTRSKDSLKTKVKTLNKKNNINYSETGKGFTQRLKWTPEIWQFLNEHSADMTIQEIRDTLANSFGLDLPRNTVHTYLNNHKISYKQVKERIKDLDSVILRIYNSLNKEELGRSLTKVIAETATLYFNKPITRIIVQNVLYRNGLMHCTSFYIAQKYKEKK